MIYPGKKSVFDIPLDEEGRNTEFGDMDCKNFFLIVKLYF